MTPGEQRGLVQALADLPTDADEYDARGILRTFLPLAEHARALHERVSVIRGDRGAGKTTLFLLLREVAARGLDLQSILGDSGIPQARWVEGFSENGAKHPMVDVLQVLGADKADASLRGFWLGYLAGVLAEERLIQLPEPFAAAWREHRNDPGRWVDTARLTLGPLSQALDRLDEDLLARGERVFVTYDHLDRVLLDDPARRRRFASVLVDLWLSLGNRYRALRPKIFLREDLYRAIRGEWPDSSKVESRSVRLTWTDAELFRLMVRHMAHHERLRGWLEDVAGVKLIDLPHLGWMPVDRFGAESSRQGFMTALSSTHMGSGANKGYSHRWIVRKASDAQGAVLPRTVLGVLRGAAHEELRNPRAPMPRLLHHISLNVGLKDASEARVSEMREEHREMDLLEGLRGKLLPLTRVELIDALRRPGVTLDVDQAVVRLLELGVLTKVDEADRVDVPDLYRFAFGIRRKGGAAQGQA